MGTLTEWVRQLVVLVFVVSAAQLLLPTDNMRPYVRFVLGLVIVGALLSSILELRTFDFDLDLMAPAAGPVQEDGSVVQRGQALTEAALARLASYEHARWQQRAEQAAAAVLSRPPRRVMVETESGGGWPTVVVVGGADDDGAADEMARLLGLPPGYVRFGEEGERGVFGDGRQ